MDRRELLEAAFDEAEAEETTEEKPSSLPEEPVVEPSGEEPHGEPIQAEKEEGTEKPKAKQAGEKPAAAPAKPDTEYDRAAKAAATEQGPKPPLSWKPAVREHWGKLPKEVREEVNRREQEVQKALSQSANSRKFTQDFGQTIQPFAHLIQAQNSTPLQAVRNLMTTAAGLMTGTSDQKARIIAEIISNYGVDVQALDSVLSGQQMPNQPAPTGHGAIPQHIMQAMQPMYSFMNEVQQARQMREQAMQHEAVQAVESFDQPFFDDLKDDMADLMEIAARKGQTMTLDQAYTKAVSLNPEISGIISQRKAAEEARRNGGTRLAKAKRIASTISGGPTSGGDGKGAPKSRREALLQNWDDAES